MVLFVLYKFLLNGETRDAPKDSRIYIGINSPEMAMGMDDSSRVYFSISDCSVGCWASEWFYSFFFKKSSDTGFMFQYCLNIQIVI